jgi:hypothetical protein
VSMIERVGAAMWVLAAASVYGRRPFMHRMFA